MFFSEKPLWTSDEIASYTNGTANKEFVANGISIDTRTIKENDLFIAIEGNNFNGHAYIDEAIEKGAGGALIASDTPQPNVKVEDTYTALYDLARGARERAEHLTAIAVTGSVGKTGTKEMLAHVLRKIDESTHATQGNLNSHLGLPLTLTRMPKDSRYGVFEMGMSQAGQILTLSKLAKPDIAIITWISAAHIEFFDGLSDIAKAKAEIFEGMDSSGIAILPFNNEQFPTLVAEARTKGISTVLSFGDNSNADAYIISSSENHNGNTVTASIMEEEVTFTLKQFGIHHAQNALSVLLAVKALEQDIQKAAKSLEDFMPVSGRGNHITLPWEDSTINVIDETYNASPEAVKATIKVLANIQHDGRRVAMLGDMLELGDLGPGLHAELSKTINEQSIDVVYCCGPLMKSLADTLPKDSVIHFEDSNALSDQIRLLLKPDDLILVKGSHGSHMEKVIEKIQKICS